MDLRFHSIITGWFEQKYREPTDAQRLGWPSILTGQHTLIAAPTGSGKTLAAFLASIDSLVRQATEISLPDETQVLYISPLKALSNDIHRNLQVPLEEIAAKAEAAFCQLSPIRIAVRTGDTPARDRQAMLRRPPHILVTTPESLYLLLTGAKSREILRNVRTVIVDEIHALARDKRGSHLTLSLARLDQLCSSPPTRIGLSATQRPIEEIARFLVGSNNVDEHGTANCQIVDTGHVRELDLAIEVPLARAVGRLPERNLARDLRPTQRIDSRTSQHARLRQHAAIGRTGMPLLGRTTRSGSGRQPSRQPLARNSAARRRAAKVGPTQGDRRHRVARARHRYRLHRPRLPTRLATIDCHIVAASRPRRPRARPCPQRDGFFH